MDGRQPFLYDAERITSRFPEKEFDPKAVTRRSWEPPKQKKPKRNGPLITFNRHPDAHEVPTGRTSTFRPMSGTTKWWVRWTRYAQVLLRSIELIGALGLLVLMILISNVDPVTAWVMRIVPGVVAISCVYSIYHHARPARARPPASSAAYQFFAAAHDLATICLYAFGAISIVNHGGDWSTLLDDKALAAVFFVPAEYYALIAAGSCHVVSLCISGWLGLVFRRIAAMPPDMNPLEDHLTRRAHKRNKSSVSTWDSSETSKRLSTPLEDRRRSGAPYEDLSRPPSIPFMHTRAGSRESFASSSSPNRDSRSDLPSRQYQIVPGNSSSSPRNSGTSYAEAKRASVPRSSAHHRGSYTEIPLRETAATASPASRPDSSAENSQQAPATTTGNASTPTRVAKFTEAWYATESLIHRTQERKRALQAAEREAQHGRAYEALAQRYDMEDYSDSDQENNGMRPGRLDVSDVWDRSDDEDDDDGGPINVHERLHPNPLRSHPTTTTEAPPPTPPKAANNNGGTTPVGRAKTPFRPRGGAAAVLGEVSTNARSASGSQDIADERLALPKSSGSKKWGRAAAAVLRNRESSIQPEDAFCARPYGDLKPATPPIMVGRGSGGGGGGVGSRQVSSGNDYYEYNGGGGAYGKSYRRNVSGKAAEEGMAGPQVPQGGYSRTILKGMASSLPA